VKRRKTFQTTSRNQRSNPLKVNDAEKHNRFRDRAEYRIKLSGVEESTAYGLPALKVHGQLLACVPANRSVEPNSLMVRVDFDDRAQLLAEDPNLYYVTDHYVGYNAVLVRLSRVNHDMLRDLLGMAYKFVTRKAAPLARGRTGKRPRPTK
jgi:hypothetical protein